MNRQLIYYLLLLLASMSGCTTITIYSPDNVETKWYLGISTVKVEPGNRSVIVKTRSIGAIKSRDLVSLGYLQDVYFLSGTGCEIVLFEPKMSNVSELLSLIEPNKSICTNLGDKPNVQ